jgi:beta-mannosidase
MDFASKSSHSLILSVPNPDLWFPQGYGQPNLYNLEVILKDGSRVLEEKTISIGIRTVRLDRSGTKRDQEFRIYINDIPVHVRGANWVPPSVMTGAITNKDYRKLIETAADANINMLRVWGGGVYECDEFYQLCNEKGIMVWQDFMFACSYYPDRKWFKEKISTEASVIIKKLRNNPSLCIWCGNNEIDWMHHSSALGSNKKFHGKSIFHKLLPGLIEELDSDTPYIPSTPIGTNSRELNSPDNGSIHNWRFWHEYAPVSELQCPLEEAPRFVTEFGIQSPPNYNTVKKCFPNVTKYSQMEFEKHNFDMEGWGKIQRYISEFFPAAKSLEDFIYLAQVTQARCVKTYVERLRAAKARNGGVLFWQFNEPVPVTCWSAVDYNKTPKALIYYAKRFYAPKTVIAVPVYCEPSAGKPKKLKNLNVTAVNDTPESFTGTLNCRLEKLNGEVIDKVSLPVSVQPFGNLPLIKIPKAIACPEDPQNSLLHLSLDTPQERIAENFYFFVPDKYLDFQHPEIGIDAKPADKGRTRLILKSNTFVKDLCIETDQGLVIQDNFIDLPAERELELIVPAKITTDQIRLQSINKCI